MFKTHGYYADIGTGQASLSCGSTRRITDQTSICGEITMNPYLAAAIELGEKRHAAILARREAKKARTKARNDFIKMMNDMFRAEKKAAKAAAREATKKPPRVKLTDEERVAKAAAREKAKSKTQMSREEYKAWVIAKGTIIQTTVRAWFKNSNHGPKHYTHRPIDEPPKRYSNGKGKWFDTEFERDEYARGWREYREWCEQNRDAIKRAAMDRANELKRERNTTPEKVLAREATRIRAIQTEKERQRWKDYKKRKHGAGGARLPWDFEEKTLDEQDGRCFYCRVEVGDDFHLDHLLPVAKGGKHHPDNLVIACPACNMAKSAKLPWEFSFALMQAA